MNFSFRRLIFGSPFETHKAHHTRLPNSLALPVFASDALSSVAYATEEILLVLVLAGTGVATLSKSIPVGIAIAVLLWLVANSYRQTIHAYPQGGGAYRVSRENLGLLFGLTAAASLLIDYVLTVAVSISAGVAAITSALPEVHDFQVPLAIGFIVFVGMMNLRGAKESGTLFAIPTYGFIGCILTLLIVGTVRLMMGHNLAPPQPPEHAWENATQSMGLFLVLKAFSSGCTALTGVEAVTDGVPAFKPPEAKNASKVLQILAVILITMFCGITFLAWKLGVVPFPAEMESESIHRHTVVSQIAYAVFGQSWPYYLVQVATAAILILAANTAFVDFPRLSMFLAQDRLLPRQLANVGDRLVYSNGIIGLTVLSIAMVVAFNASTHHLIPLYALGVFLSFTLSQAGMVSRWMRLRPEGWQIKAAVNAVGATATFVVLIIIGITKFTAGEPVDFYPLTTIGGIWLTLTIITGALVSMNRRIVSRWIVGLSITGMSVAFGLMKVQPLQKVEIHLGAWLVMAAIPALVWMCLRINEHYAEVADHLTMSRYDHPVNFQHTVLLLVSGVHRGVMPAITYARSMGGDVRAVYVEIEPEKTPLVQERWQQYVRDIPLVVLESPFRSLVEPLSRYIDQVESERDDDVVTVIVPEFVTDKWWTKLMHGHNGLLVKWALLFKRNVVVTNVRYYLDSRPGTPDHLLTSTREEMAQNHVSEFEIGAEKQNGHSNGNGGAH